MAFAKRFVVTFILGFLLQNSYSVEVDSGAELFDVLLARIESLEASDAANKAKIAEMESEFKMKLTVNEREISSLKLKMDEMESNYKLKEDEMLDQINELKMNLAQGSDDSAEQHLDGSDDAERPLSGPNSIQRRGSNIRKYREVPETEVAFYATHTDHDIHHLGSNQVLEFPIAVTNLGDAYNNNTGGFVAPVDGTYVLHATVMGVDIAANHHMQVHFDVSGTVYSKFYVTPYDQSSQMLVIELKAGQTVTVRNDVVDDGFVGQHYTTFSGFLLYQHFPSGAIIGK